MKYVSKSISKRAAACAVAACCAWTCGNTAAAQVPLSTFTYTASKDSNTYDLTIVGPNPFSPPYISSPVSIVVVPLKVFIGPYVFDPTAQDPCGPYGLSPEALLSLSPLRQPVSNLTINGVNVGNVTFPDGFRRAEFWTVINSTYHIPLTYRFADPVGIAPPAGGLPAGIVVGAGCTLQGILSLTWFQDTLEQQLIPQLTTSGVISSNNVVIFLVHNIGFAQGPPPVNTANCCAYGYHTAMTNPGSSGPSVQIYLVGDWDSSGNAPPDSVSLSHELAETLDDPMAGWFGNDAAPSWGNIGQKSACVNPPIWEVGDPFLASSTVTVSSFGLVFHVQELAFFSWFYNGQSMPSIGAAGKFSSNGHFTGPSQPCPPGGTF